jgi:hypothetical protein
MTIGMLLQEAIGASHSRETITAVCRIHCNNRIRIQLICDSITAVAPV